MCYHINVVSEQKFNSDNLTLKKIVCVIKKYEEKTCLNIYETFFTFLILLLERILFSLAVNLNPIECKSISVFTLSLVFLDLLKWPTLINVKPGKSSHMKKLHVTF
jgi:hypothetical protein